MNNESDEILYSVRPQYRVKDYIKLNKIINKKMYISIRIFTIILFFLEILTLEFNYISKAEIFMKIFFLIILWNSPNIVSYKSIKNFVSSNRNTILNFYKDYFKEENENSCTTTYYNKIHKIYKSKNRIILKTKEPTQYTIIRGKNSTEGSISDIATFLQSVINKDSESNDLYFKKVLMENEANFIVSNVYDDSKILEVYKIVARKLLVTIRIILISVEVLFIIYGVYVKIELGTSITLIAAFLVGILYIYIGFNLEKNHIKQANKTLDLMKNLPENLYFYDSYFLYENKNAGINTLGRIDYNKIDSVHISENIFIIRLTETKQIMVVDKSGFKLGTLEEFTDFLQEKFHGKIIKA